MTHETYQQHWLTSATDRAEQGILNGMVANELFDHTWKAAINELERNLELKDGQTVLDAGCGWGRLLFGVKYFHPGISVDGYELAPEFAEKAREILRQSNLDDGVNIVQADLLDVDLPSNRYDSFYCSRVLHYIEPKAQLVGKLYSALKPGGKGIIIVPNSNSPRQRLLYRHAPLYPIRSVGEIMEGAGFKNLHYGGYRVLPARKRFSHESIAAKIESSLASTPLGRFAGLAYAVGEK